MADTSTTLTWDAAKRLVQDVEDAFGAADLARIEQGFTEDAVTRFADFPEMRGRAAIMRFLRARFARTKGYRLRKTLHCLMGDVLANTWDANWEDAQTGKPMLGRGTEIWSRARRPHRAVGCDVQRLGEGRPAESRRWCNCPPPANAGRVSRSPLPLREGATGRGRPQRGQINRKLDFGTTVPSPNPSRKGEDFLQQTVRGQRRPGWASTKARSTAFIRV